MVTEWKVYYRPVSPGSGPIADLIIPAASSDKALEAARKIPGIEVLHAVLYRHILDWAQQVFTPEEAAEYCRVSRRTIDNAMSDSELPKARDGYYPKFTREQLDRFIASRMSGGMGGTATSHHSLKAA